MKVEVHRVRSVSHSYIDLTWLRTRSTVIPSRRSAHGSGNGCLTIDPAQFGQRAIVGIGDEVFVYPDFRRYTGISLAQIDFVLFLHVNGALNGERLASAGWTVRKDGSVETLGS